MEALIANTIIGYPRAVAWTYPTQAKGNRTSRLSEYGILLSAYTAILHRGTGTFSLGVAYVLLSRIDPSEV
jgi:hypothetical protein